MQQPEIIKNLFRSESGKITAVLARHFGLENLQLAEDIVMDTFLVALETWPYKGLPSNPVAWLYTVAKNKASNAIKRNHLFRNKIQPGLMPQPEQQSPDLDLSRANIEDSQLRMLFAICHPLIPDKSRIGIALRVLCGFGTEEIASAFNTSQETINKRLYRARQLLRNTDLLKQLSPSDLPARLGDVLTTLYLLFNEGYYSETNNEVIRKDLCLEAMRLTYFLAGIPSCADPKVNALFALMCFHTSRLEARLAGNGDLILYDDQDTSKWNTELIGRGALALKQSATGDQYSTYHLEAGIAYWHTIPDDGRHKWQNILQLYDRLLEIAYTPAAALNRTYALFRAQGKEEALKAVSTLPTTESPYFYALIGEIYKGDDASLANEYFKKAIFFSRTMAEKAILESKINPSLN